MCRQSCRQIPEVIYKTSSPLHLTYNYAGSCHKHNHRNCWNHHISVYVIFHIHLFFMLIENNCASILPQYLQFFASRFFPPLKIPNLISIIRNELTQSSSYPVIWLATTLDTMQNWETKLSCKNYNFSILNSHTTLNFKVLISTDKFLMCKIDSDPQ